MINYLGLQATVINLLTNFGAIPVTITNIPDPTSGTSIVMRTIGVMTGGKVANIDVLQNPTIIAGTTGQIMYVPGNITTPPDVGGQVSYKLNGKSWVQNISSVESTNPTGTALLYALQVE
jgi:hypothetical protein